MGGSWSQDGHILGCGGGLDRGGDPSQVFEREADWESVLSPKVPPHSGHNPKGNAAGARRCDFDWPLGFGLECGVSLSIPSFPRANEHTVWLLCRCLDCVGDTAGVS